MGKNAPAGDALAALESASAVMATVWWCTDSSGPFATAPASSAVQGWTNAAGGSMPGAACSSRSTSWRGWRPWCRVRAVTSSASTACLLPTLATAASSCQRRRPCSRATERALGCATARTDDLDAAPALGVRHRHQSVPTLRRSIARAGGDHRAASDRWHPRAHRHAGGSGTTHRVVLTDTAAPHRGPWRRRQVYARVSSGWVSLCPLRLSAAIPPHVGCHRCRPTLPATVDSS